MPLYGITVGRDPVAVAAVVDVRTDSPVVHAADGIATGVAFIVNDFHESPMWPEIEGARVPAMSHCPDHRTGRG